MSKSLFTHTAAPLLGLAALAALGLAAAPASAQTQIFDLTYAGINGSAATATGTITLDESKINNPGVTQQNGYSFVTAFSLTVTGASSGNGTFDLADYQGSVTNGGFYLDTHGGTLDFTKELVGQPTSASGSPFGTTYDGTSGDFSISINGTGAAVGAPVATYYFTLTTDDNRGDDLHLTSFKPEAAAAPEPSQFAGLGFAVLGVGGLALHARKRKIA